MANSSRSAALKYEIESRLAVRIPGALSPLPVQAPRLLAIGIPAVESLLGGGLPLGGITELTGDVSSGRTSLALSILAEASAEAACAYVDTNDTFDPKSAAAAGVRLQNLLWVRFAHTEACHSSAAKPPIRPAPPLTSETRANHQHCGYSHPRTETKGLDRALEAMLRQKATARLSKAEGTPGFPNQKLSLVSASSDQISYEHFNARRADDSDPLRRLNRKAAGAARDRARQTSAEQTSTHSTEQSGRFVERAISATDRILQAGGFRVVVLDLASTPVEQAFRVPAATWFRFRRSAQESDTVFLLLTQQPCARSSAACVIECGASPNVNTGKIFRGLTNIAQVARQRSGGSFEKKMPGRVTSWEATTPWMRGAGK